jgi:hypothetical protein
MNPLTDFLNSGGDPASLGIRARRSTVNPELVLFLYSHIDSPKGHPIADSARGIILDESNDWACVSRPFDRFFNYGEPAAAAIDWPNATVYEKEDGSLCSLYHHKGKWHVATKGEPDAAGPVGDVDLIFSELFWQVFEGFRLPSAEMERLTFMFELCTMQNRVVVKHPTPRLALLSVRDRETGAELPLADFEGMYPQVQAMQLWADPEALNEVLPIMNPAAFEGFVVCDANFNRVKIKHPGYLRLHRIKEGANPKAILDLVRTGEDAEFLAYFPEFTERFAEARAALNGLVAHLRWAYGKCCDADSQKDFAAAVRASGCVMPGVLFQMRKSPNRTTEEILSGVRIAALMRGVEMAAITGG